MVRTHSDFTFLLAGSPPAVTCGSTSIARYPTRLRWALVLGLVCVGGWPCEPAWAGGPQFVADVSIFTSDPSLTFTDTGQDDASWEICIDQSCSLTNGEVDQGFHISVVDNGPDSIPFIIENGSGQNLLRLDSNERIGINTSAPQTTLDIHAGTPEIRLDDTSAGAGQVDLRLNTTTFAIEGSSDQNIIELSTSAPATMDIDSFGNTAFSGRLEVVTTVAPEIRLFDTGTGTGDRVDFRLSSTTFNIEGTTDQDIIELSTRAPATMDIDSLGNTVFFGDLQVNSSRDAKEGIEAVDGGAVLAKLVELPIHRWTYRKDEGAIQHMGPMAEDFHAAFGLGQTEKHISVIDSAGVVLAAVQELALRVESLERDNEGLRNELRDARLSR